MRTVSSQTESLTIAGEAWDVVTVEGDDQRLRCTGQTRVRSQLVASVLCQVMGKPWSDLLADHQPVLVDGEPALALREIPVQPLPSAVDPDDMQLMSQLDAAGLVDALMGQQSRSWQDLGRSEDGQQLIVAPSSSSSALPDGNDYHAQHAALQFWRASDPVRAQLSDPEREALTRLLTPDVHEWVTAMVGPARADAMRERIEATLERGRVLGAPPLEPAHASEWRTPLGDLSQAWEARRNIQHPAMQQQPPDLSGMDESAPAHEPALPLHEQLEALGAHTMRTGATQISAGGRTIDVRHIPAVRGHRLGGYTRLRWENDHKAVLQLVASRAEHDPQRRTFVTVQAPGDEPGQISWMIPLDDQGNLDLEDASWPGVAQLRGSVQMQEQLQGQITPVLAQLETARARPGREKAPKPSAKQAADAASNSHEHAESAQPGQRSSTRFSGW